MTGPDAKTRGLVMVRDGGRCRRCGAVGHELQHRKPRKMGGRADRRVSNSPANLVLLCRLCHRHIELHRLDAYRDGWLVREGANPTEQPLHPLDGSVVMLHRDGTITVSAPLTSWTSGGELWLTEPPF